MTVRMVYDPTLDDGLGVGGYVPRFACDSCGALIDDGVEGIVMWVVPEADADVIQPVFHVHKGTCDNRLRRTLESQGGLTYWTGLVDHTIHLANGVVERGRGPGGIPLVEPTTEHPHNRP